MVRENPKSPITMEGVPARISKSRLKNHLICGGQYSARKIPVASPSGTAKEIERIIRSRVPIIAGKRPSNTGFFSKSASRGLVSEKSKFKFNDRYPFIIKNPIMIRIAPTRIMLHTHEKDLKILSVKSLSVKLVFIYDASFS